MGTNKRNAITPERNPAGTLRPALSLPANLSTHGVALIVLASAAVRHDCTQMRIPMVLLCPVVGLATLLTSCSRPADHAASRTVTVPVATGPLVQRLSQPQQKAVAGPVDPDRRVGAIFIDNGHAARLHGFRGAFGGREPGDDRGALPGRGRPDNLRSRLRRRRSAHRRLEGRRRLPGSALDRPARIRTPITRSRGSATTPVVRSSRTSAWR